MSVKVPKQNLWRAIRRKCMDCCAYQQKEVQLCLAVDCPLHDFRMPRVSKKAHTGERDQRLGPQGQGVGSPPGARAREMHNQEGSNDQKHPTQGETHEQERQTAQGG